MSNKIGVINYGIAGNVYSIKKAVKKAGGSIQIIDNSKDLNKADKIILPGVGSFKDGIQELKGNGLFEALQSTIINKPTLGICLGMQLLSKLGFEYGKTEGLGVISGEVVPIKVSEKIPHMGFNTVGILRNNDLLKGIEDQFFYFMHSYELINYTNVTSVSSYGTHRFVSSIQNGHIYGTQFHPEKSRDVGIEFFRNFIDL